MPPKTATAIESQQPQESPFPEHLQAFVNSVTSLRTTLHQLIIILHRSTDLQGKNASEFLKSLPGCQIEQHGDAGVTIKATMTADQYAKYEPMNQDLQHSIIAAQLLPRLCIVSLVSHFDVLFANLVRSFFEIVPQRLDDSDKTLSISELMQLGSIEAARSRAIEKEVESLLRENHAKQISWLEKALGIPLRKDLLIWPTFIEVTERRNLFVHSEGIVSTQYLTVCRDHKVSLAPGLTVGSSLDVPQEYFLAACDTILEMGVKLAHVVWRKLLPKEVDRANASLVQIGIDVITATRYDLAIELLRFPSTLPQKPDDTTALLLKINIAQAFKWKGDIDQCQRTLDKIGWGSLAEKFHLAKAVLTDDFDLAAKMMRRIARNDPMMNEHSYQRWPIFREFRNSPQYAAAYQAVFGGVTVSEPCPDQQHENTPPTADDTPNSK